jgi:phosphate-selective porin OprO/OprP
LREFTSWSIACLLALGLAAAPAQAESGDKSVTEKVLDILKDQGSIDDEKYDELMREAEEEKKAAALTAAGSPAEPNPEGWSAYWKDGTRIERNDGYYKIKLGGRIQYDFAGIGSESDVNDEFDVRGTGTDVRRARLFMSGNIGEHGIFKAQYDFAGSDADMKDLYGGLTKLPVVGTARAGHFYEPFSLSQQTSSKYMTFMERGLPILAFSKERNAGLGFNNTAFDQRMTWAIGGYRETDDDGEDFSNDGNYNVGIRMTGLPVYEDGGKELVHVGYSYSHRFQNNETVTFAAKPEANTAPRLASTAPFDDQMLSDGVDVLGGELATVHGPLSFQSEVVAALVDRDKMSDRTFWGITGQVSYFLTGENRVYDQKAGAFGRTAPNQDFSISKGQWGAFEVAARYSHLSLNDGSIRGGILNDYTVGVNWYLYRNLRLMVNGVWAHLNGVGDTYIGQTRVSLDF